MAFKKKKAKPVVKKEAAADPAAARAKLPHRADEATAPFQGSHNTIPMTKIEEK